MTNVGAANDANLVKINISFSVYKHIVNESIEHISDKRNPDIDNMLYMLCLILGLLWHLLLTWFNFNPSMDK